MIPSNSISTRRGTGTVRVRIRTLAQAPRRARAVRGAAEVNHHVIQNYLVCAVQVTYCTYSTVQYQDNVVESHFHNTLVSLW